MKFLTWSLRSADQQMIIELQMLHAVLEHGMCREVLRYTYIDLLRDGG